MSSQVKRNSETKIKMKPTLKVFCAVLAISPGLLWLNFGSIELKSTAASTRYTKRTSFHKPLDPVSVQQQRNTKPRPFDASRPIAFIHIGKNAGSSIDSIFAKAKNMLHFYYVGGKHFDLSYARKKLPNAQETF